MPLQNRVDPFGAIKAVADRGLLTGNRGVIHDPATRRLLTRRWTTRAWIICVCDFRGRRRQLMGPGKNGNGSWTELFFLDEVTALAAGHRPCFYCSRARAVEFAGRFARTNALIKVRAPDIDIRLHSERLAAGANPEAITPKQASTLPDGAMITVDGHPLAMRNGKALPWSFAGYGHPIDLQTTGARQIKRLTPATTCAILADGYRPVWHPSSVAPV